MSALFVLVAFGVGYFVFFSCDALSKCWNKVEDDKYLTPNAYWRRRHQERESHYQRKWWEELIGIDTNTHDRP